MPIQIALLSGGEFKLLDRAGKWFVFSFPWGYQGATQGWPRVILRSDPVTLECVAKLTGLHGWKAWRPFAMPCVSQGECVVQRF